MEEIHKYATVIISGWRKYDIANVSFSSLHLIFSIRNIYGSIIRKNSKKMLLTNQKREEKGSLCWRPIKKV